MRRAHTVAVAVAIALIPLTPLVLRVYAGFASVSRDAAVARNERILRSVPPVPGTKLVSTSTSQTGRWGVEGSLVPTDYSTRFVFSLPATVLAGTVMRHYRQALHDWEVSQGEHDGTAFSHGSTRIEIAFDEPAGFSVYVSQ